MRHHIFQLTLFGAYILGITILMIVSGIGITPGRYSFVLILGTLFIKKTRKFLLDWIPFLFIFISYEFLSGFTGSLNFRVHFIESYHFDQFFFHTIPTIQLQNSLYTPGALHWYDYMGVTLYLLHFALIFIFGLILWFKDLFWFRQYIIGLLLLSYGALITYIVFPSSPPWLASQSGYIPKVYHITEAALAHFPNILHLPALYQNLNPNPIAAIPSLHTAFPFLVLLFSVSFFKWKGFLFLPYFLAIVFSIVYMGEHYIVDVLIGMIYASGFFIGAKILSHHRKILSKLSLPFKTSKQ